MSHAPCCCSASLDRYDRCDLLVERRVCTCLLLLGVSVVCSDTGGAGNGPTEAINGIVELGRRAASTPPPTVFEYSSSPQA